MVGQLRVHLCNYVIYHTYDIYMIVILQNLSPNIFQVYIRHIYGVFLVHTMYLRASFHLYMVYT